MTPTAIDLEIPTGAPCWMDLMTSDPDASVAFYTELFGWTSREPEHLEGYRYFEKDGRAVGGCMRNEPEWGTPDGWSVYLRSDDVRVTAAAAAASGGSLLMEPMDVEPNGSFAILTDAGGAMVSAWQNGTETGFQVLREDGAPVHFELHTRDYDATVRFYREVFGWTPEVLADEPGFRYSTFAGPEDPRAGIMDAVGLLAPDAAPHWSVYLGVSDVEATLARATTLGGTVVAPADATPYGVLAVVADPTGAVFKLRG